MTDTITVVSGLPRSGTSMMMGMLAAGGLPVLMDDMRPRDADNPRGYFEYGPVKRLRQNTSWFPMARGKAIKVVSPLLTALPLAFRYNIIFMERNLDDVLASQRIMVIRHENAETHFSVPINPEQLDSQDTRLKCIYVKHLRHTLHWLDRHKMRIFRIRYEYVLEYPTQAAHEIIDFLDIPLNADAMASTVAPECCRQGKYAASNQPKSSVLNSRPQ